MVLNELTAVQRALVIFYLRATSKGEHVRLVERISAGAYFINNMTITFTGPGRKELPTIVRMGQNKPYISTMSRTYKG